MNRIWKVSKYLLYDLKNALVVYYGVILALSALAVISTLRLLASVRGEVTVSGLSSASLIFFFIVGLNSFKTNFRFMQANNVSRKRFFAGNILALLITAAFVAAIDAVITVVLSRIIPYTSFFQQIYKSDIMLGDFVWSFALLSFAVTLGLFITMLYYRCSKLMKVVISITPVIFMILINFINDYQAGAVRMVLGKFFTAVFSLNHLNPYIAALNILVGAAGLAAAGYLLIYKAPVKD